MEDLIGLLIFAGIAAVSMIAKVAEKRKAEQQRQANEGKPKTRREDLPEATRRMLYGDGAGPRTATPRDGGEPATARPATVEPRTATPTVTPSASPPQQAYRPRTAPDDVRRQREQRMAEAPQKRRGGMAQPQALAQTPSRQVVEPRQASRESLQEAYRQRHPRGEQQAPRPQPRQRTRQPQLPPQQRTASVQQQRRPAKRKYKSELAWLFSTPKTVRHGIVMMEILGKPKGLQDF